MSEQVTVTTTEPPAPATSAETTALAEQVGETKVEAQQAVETSEAAAAVAATAASAATQAAEAAQTAAAVASTPPAVPDTSQFVTRDELAALLTPPAPVVIEPPATPEPDPVPKSREKRVKRRSLADRYYNR